MRPWAQLLGTERSELATPPLKWTGPPSDWDVLEKNSFSHCDMGCGRHMEAVKHSLEVTNFRSRLHSCSAEKPIFIVILGLGGGLAIYLIKNDRQGRFFDRAGPQWNCKASVVAAAL